ncbi:leucine-rich repeat protein, partial [Sodaliphilus sp.]|uniref:leucine-rich repeat protein n=1 Tax=Sodaliphilus sp. TaxID=2815818 RepID=UPI0038905519
MKKLLSLFVMVAVAVSAMAAVGDDFNFQNCTYLITKEYVNSAEYGEITCVGLNATGKAAQSLDLTIPNILSRGSNPTRFYRVTKIKDEAFRGNTNIVSLKISDKIGHVGKLAFGWCVSLKTLDCAAVELGVQAFQSCDQLSKVTLQEGLTKIDAFAFANSGVSEIKIPASVTSIGRMAFRECSNLSTFTVNANNKYYADYNNALYTKDYNSILYVPRGAKYDTLMKVHGNTTIVETEAFFDYIDYKSWVILPYGIKTIKSDAFYCSEVERLVIPATIQTIEPDAFRKCEYLNHLFVNKKGPFVVSKIFTDAHKPHLYVPYGSEDYYKANGWGEVQDVNTRGLVSFDLINHNGIAATVTSTVPCTGNDGKSYAGRCSMVKPPMFADDDNLYNIPDFYDVGQKQFALTSIAPRIKSSYSEQYSYYGGTNVDSIANEAFINAQIKSVALPNVKYIGKSAFEGCTNLLAFEFSKTLRYIGTNAFKNCKLNGVFPTGYKGYKNYHGDVILPTTIISIGADAFYGTAVNRIVVPNSIKSLSTDAFRGMGKVQEIYLNQYPPEWDQFRFTNVPSTCKLYVPVGKTFVMRDKIGSAFKSDNILGGAFDFAYKTVYDIEFSRLKEPATIISDQAFYQDGVRYDGKVKYVRCPTISIPNNFTASNYLENNGKKYLVTEIDDSCFTNFSNMTATDLSRMTALERIGYRAFTGTSVTSLTIPETCTRFGTGAFFQATKLKELVILGTKPRTWDAQYYGFNASGFMVYVNNEVLYSNYWNKDYSSWNKNDNSDPRDALAVYVKPDYDNYNLGVCIPLDFATSGVNAYVASGFANDNTIKTARVNSVRAHNGVILTDLTPGKIYKINRSTNPIGTSNFSASSRDDVNLSPLVGGYYWDCNAKKFSRPSDTSRPFYTGLGRSYLDFTFYQGQELFIDLWPNTPEGKKGDVNGDGEVDITDANILTNIILGKDTASNYGGRADVDGNGAV